MATTSRTVLGFDNGYPTSDGKPMAETDLHRELMIDLIETLKAHFEADPMTYVSGDLLLFYEEGNKRKHVAPDVFVVRGVPMRQRSNYLLWEEGKGPDVIIEVTSKTTRREDQTKKRALYREVLRVPEYFLFDPTEDYLKPPMQGYRLVGGDYIPIDRIDGRLPSEVLGLHLQRVGWSLRLYDPELGRWLLTPREAADQAEADRRRAEVARERAEIASEQAGLARQRAEIALARAELERRRIEVERLASDEARVRAEAENVALRREVEELRRRLGGD
jgi:Uma2 family endonuclease